MSYLGCRGPTHKTDRYRPNRTSCATDTPFRFDGQSCSPRPLCLEKTEVANPSCEHPKAGSRAGNRLYRCGFEFWYFQRCGHSIKAGAVRDGFGLRRATVLQVASHLSSGNRDDYLHKALANAAGPKLKERIGSGDHIAVAGGRAVYQTVRAIRRGRPIQRDITVTPLCGRVWSHSWDVHKWPMDADDAAFFWRQPLRRSLRQSSVR